jgi:hypothetical protein
VSLHQHAWVPVREMPPTRGARETSRTLKVNVPSQDAERNSPPRREQTGLPLPLEPHIHMSASGLDQIIAATRADRAHCVR